MALVEQAPETSPAVTPFRRVPKTGVIYVSSEAAKRGFRPGSQVGDAPPGAAGDPAERWANLGQGQPETGPLPGAPPRRQAVAIDPADHDYAPVAGLWELREAVAELYNHLYRRGLGSRYSAENVAVSGGGRAALTRAAAVLGRIHLGHFLPDYTAYEELLDIFRLFLPMPLLLDRERGYEFSAADLEREILGLGLSGLLFSNPCNPTGKLVAGDAMADWVGLARRLECALLVDEFYSHYIWRPSGGGATAPAPDPVSAAAWVEDVDRDPVVLFDGLTKNWRYPGWRVTWAVGPRAVIEAMTSAGSFLDGGGSKPLQRATVPLLAPDDVLAETAAIRRRFTAKRQLMLERVERMGMLVDRQPEGTFYVWASLENLPPGLRDGMDFFRAALERKVICVPGLFFDVNPGRRRSREVSRFRHHIRLSFGPPIEEVEAGLDRLEEMVSAA